MKDYIQVKGDDLTGTLNIGECLISSKRAKEQAKEFGIDFEEEVLHLVIHGLLHLLGFDHEISHLEEVLMEKYEKKLWESFGKRVSKR